MKPEDPKNDFLMIKKKGDKFIFRDDEADGDHYFICVYLRNL